MTEDNMMEVLSFRWSGRFGHFRRAEANRHGLTYPLPPRTAILGLLGAVLGLEKDAPQEVLRGILLSWSGPVPRRFWHRVKLRKDPPSPLPRRMTPKAVREKTGAEVATLMNFEIMWKPFFRVDLALPGNPDLFSDLLRRFEEELYHFTPCLGLSELTAGLEFLGTAPATALPEGTHEVEGCMPQGSVRLLPARDPLSLQLVRLPFAVDGKRRFIHRPYLIETRGAPVAVETKDAVAVGERILILQ